jgi:hypothetical protein
MARRKRQQQAGLEFLDDVVDSAVDSLFGRASEFVERVRDGQRAAFTEEQLRQSFKCFSCQRVFPVDQMEQLHPSNGFGTCKSCFSFIVTAAKEKIAAFGKRAARGAQQRGARPQGMPQPPTEPPWEVLGIDMHASTEAIKKAYKKLALQWHPDRWAGGSPEDKHRADLMFKKVTAAKEVMLKVRQPPEG